MKAIRDLINGNLTDAKKAAKNRSFSAILTSAQEHYGMSAHEAINTATYLKGEITYQTYCQNKHALTFAE
jgi:hypothetical protein